MQVQFDIVGDVKPHNHPRFELDAVPREGETITLPGLPTDLQIVRTVVWYPAGDPDDPESTESFVYVVVGPRRKEW